MIVICVDNLGTARGRLTVDKKYKVIEVSPHLQYKIKEDNGEETWWDRDRFIEIG